MEKSKVILSWHLFVDCPHCEEQLDLSEHDDDGIYSGPIFNNSWDELKNEEVECNKCHNIFLIESVEY